MSLKMHMKYADTVKIIFKSTFSDSFVFLTFPFLPILFCSLPLMFLLFGWVFFFFFLSFKIFGLMYPESQPSLFTAISSDILPRETS